MPFAMFTRRRVVKMMVSIESGHGQIIITHSKMLVVELRVWLFSMKWRKDNRTNRDMEKASFDGRFVFSVRVNFFCGLICFYFIPRRNGLLHNECSFE